MIISVLMRMGVGSEKELWHMSLARALQYTHTSMVIEGVETDWSIANVFECNRVDEKFDKYFK